MLKTEKLVGEFWATVTLELEIVIRKRREGEMGRKIIKAKGVYIDGGRVLVGGGEGG